MIGKVLVGITIAVLTGGLVFGAINRTASRGNEIGNGYNSENLNGSGSLQKGDEYTRGLGNRISNVSEGRDTYFGEGIIGNAGTDLSLSTGIESWFELTGTVKSVDSDSLKILTSDNSVLEISRRPWWFAQEQGFSTTDGDDVLLTGFMDGDEFEMASIKNLSNGISTTIRDEAGIPLWAGSGG